MRVLLIDPNVSTISPSMKGLIEILPALHQRGIQFDAWCTYHDEGLPLNQVDKVSKLSHLPLLGGYVFTFLVRFRYWWRYKRLGKRPDALVFTVATYIKENDLCLVTFSPFDWDQRMQSLQMNTLKEKVLYWLNKLNILVSRDFYKNTKSTVVLPVSQAVKEDLMRENPQLNCKVFPNCYDPSRFNLEAKNRYQKQIRQQLSIDANDCVFSFASAGHYKRKGFYEAVETIAQLHAKYPHVKLLVIGGTLYKLKELQHELELKFPNWRNFIVFTGMVKNVEAYLASSDAFFFPSYSEAFALVEIEAAACGIPLFLTAHHGSEMILRDGVNGRHLNFDVVHMVQVLEEFITGQWQPSDNRPLGAIDKKQYEDHFYDLFTQTDLKPL